MSHIIAPKISSKLFHWSGNAAVAEASELLGLPFLSRIWDDSCDIGFVVVSSKTGAEAVFYLDYIDWGFGPNQDVEQDEIAGWKFKSLHGTYTILIIND